MKKTKERGGLILNRLDRIPVWPYSQLVLVSIGAGFFFAFFDIVALGLALPKIEQAFHVSAEIAAWSITSGLIGYILGSFIDSRISDCYGRQIGIYLSILFFSAGSLFCAFSQSIESFVLWRLVSGMGLGAEIALVTTLVGELSPAACRGRYTSRAVAFGMLGFAVVPFVGMFIVPNYSWGWRALFVIGGLGGLLIFFTRLWVPESPRWLVAQGSFEKADEIVTRAEVYARKRLNMELPPPATTEPVIPARLSLSHVFKAPYHRRLILFIAIWFVYYLGNYAWLTLSTNLFFDKGFHLAKSIDFVAIGSCGFILGSIFPILWGDKIERKKFAAGVALIWTMALLAIGWFPTESVIIVGGLIASTSIAAIIPIMYAYTAENFPTSARATCLSITDGLGHLGGAICGQVIFGIYALFQHIGFGFQAAFSCMALTGLITAILLMQGMSMTRATLQ